MEGKNIKPRILYPARISFRFHGEIKSFTDKQKLREFSTTKPALQQILKELLQAEKKCPKVETRKLRMGKLTSKGKHTVKVGNHLHINMISKPAIIRGQYKCRKWEMHLKLRDQQLKTILYIYRLLYGKPHWKNPKKKIYNRYIHTHTHTQQESKQH